MKQIPAGVVLFVAAAIVVFVLLLLGQTSWAHEIREATAASNQSSATREQSGINTLLLPFIKNFGAMLVPGLMAVGSSSLLNRQLAKTP